MYKALLWNKEGKKIRCNLCFRRCLIPEDSQGFCRTRENYNGVLYASKYGEISTMAVDPIEKKPFFHFFPGTKSYSISTTGCTFRCKFCQNYDITQRPFSIKKMNPEDIVKEAIRIGCRTISYTYNEPTVFFEYAVDTAKQALKKGIINVFVTNGYMTPDAIDYASKYVQAMTIGIKASLNTKFATRFMYVPKVDLIKDSIIEMKQKKIHIEITDLLVTKYGDNLNDVRSLVRWIYDSLGPNVPLHFTRFHPDWLLTNVIPTPVKTLERAHAIAKNEGMRYVYTGNIMNHSLENTYCPECNEILIKRFNFYIKDWKIVNGKCPFCHYKIYYINEP